MDRKWSARKLAAGDYVLPSNDRQTLWRIKSYDEDGSGPPRGRYWELWRWVGEIVEEDVADSIVYDEWQRWEIVSSVIPTRKEAIEEALRLGEG